jgi:hypothetical protein
MSPMHGEHMLNDCTSSTFSHGCDLIWITSKVGDVLFCPFESNNTVPEARIWGHIFSRRRHPARWSETIVRAHSYKGLVGIHLLKEARRIPSPIFASKDILEDISDSTVIRIDSVRLHHKSSVELATSCFSPPRELSHPSISNLRSPS